MARPRIRRPAPAKSWSTFMRPASNAADYKVRLGGGRYSLNRFPHILGRDFSGVVSMLGTGVTDFIVGDAVFGVTDHP